MPTGEGGAVKAAKRPAGVRRPRAAETIQVVLTIVAIVSAILVAGLVGTQLSLQAKQPVPAAWRLITNAALRLFGVSLTDPVAYASAVSTALNGLLILVTLVFAALPLYTGILYRRRLREQQSLQVYEISTDGVDDLNVMYKYYEKAEGILVFSGDFSWLKNDTRISSLLLGKGDRVTYTSYKSRAEIEASLGHDLFGAVEKRFRFARPVPLKCSIVSYSADKVFLYKTQFVAANGDIKSMICVVSPSDDSRYLLDALEGLCRQASGGQVHT